MKYILTDFRTQLQSMCYQDIKRCCENQSGRLRVPPGVRWRPEPDGSGAEGLLLPVLVDVPQQLLHKVLWDKR